MNRTILAPLFVLSGICGTIVLMAVTNVFDPLVKFIHNEAITPVEAGACLIFTMAGLGVSYFLLNILCSYFVPRINTLDKTHTNTSKEQQKHISLRAENSNTNI